MFRSNFPSAHVLTPEPLDENAFRDWFISEDVEPKPEVLDVINKAARGNPALFSTILQSARDVLPKRSAPQKAASFSPERLPTVEVVRPPTPAAITYDDDPSETHGPHVVTRGAHTLSVPENYRIGSFPVTNGIFGEFIRDGGYQQEEFWRSVHPSIRAGFVCVDKTPGPASWLSARAPVEYPLYPVAGISYHEALAFIAWLERSVAPPVEGMQWLLPTEDMWEYAARGPSGFLYPWGPKFETGRCNSREANLRAPSLSGRFPSGVSPFGAEDMAGNVWEFVRAADQDRGTCALRGGSFSNNADEVKASLRLIHVPRDHRPFDFGFRCALEPRVVTAPPQQRLPR
jgi:formylglycine-generating enzyme required for sulfatase activity